MALGVRNLSMYCEDPCSLEFGSELGGLVNESSLHLSDFVDEWGSESLPLKQSLVLDGENLELVKASSVRIGNKPGTPMTKTVAALKSHSEAERRRRERINAHLATLRDLVPSNEKMDKATLLAQVINQVKQLKTNATQASEGLHIPMESNEAKVEMLENNKAVDGSFLIRASIGCEYRSDLLANIRQAINELPLPVKVRKSEISTLGGRIKIVFLITTPESEDAASRGVMAGSVRVALSNILERVSASAEYEQELLFPQKRRRVALLDKASLLL